MDKTWKKYYTVIWIEKVLENKIIGTEFFSLVIIDIKEFQGTTDFTYRPTSEEVNDGIQNKSWIASKTCVTITQLNMI